MTSDFSIKDYLCLHRKFLVYNLIMRNLKIRYRKSFFGMFWTLLIPAGSAGIYYLVFHHILKVSVPNYLLFIISGIVPWAFFTTTIGSSVEVIVGNYGLLNKVPLPAHSLVLSEALTHILNLILGLPIVMAIQIFSGVGFGWANFQYLILLGILFFTAYGIGLIFSLAYVYFRDLKYVVSLIIQFWFYLTPVMYETKRIPEKFLFLLHVNPVGFLFSGFHNSLVNNEWLTLEEWCSIIGWALAVNIIAYYLLKKTRFHIVEIL